MFDGESEPSVTEDAAVRLARLVYVTASLTAAGAVFVAKANIAWRDPWMTPRWTPDFILFWGVRNALDSVLMILAMCGLLGLLVCHSLRRRIGVWASVILALAALYLLGT